MVAVPAPTGVTSPLLDTVATLVSELFQVMAVVTPETVSWEGPSLTERVKSSLFSLWLPPEPLSPVLEGAAGRLPVTLQRTMHTPFLLPSDTTTLTVPRETAVTLPFWSTEAIPSSSLAQV